MVLVINRHHIDEKDSQDRLEFNQLLALLVLKPEYCIAIRSIYLLLGFLRRPSSAATILTMLNEPDLIHDDVIKWKHFPRYWPFVRGIHRSPVNSPHRGQLRGALVFSLICAWINDWVNNREAGYLRRHRAHHDVTVMILRGRFQFPCRPEVAKS